ncbi:MAG: peroxidase-related enzyme [Thermoplasmatota archaeon]|nr:peroxidase-related enzyme [Candidatus Thermoplasmatota archaeon]MBU1913870.1 peroxidase-related enzyme [Candidatus Thermoplasmatota archaeon]
MAWIKAPNKDSVRGKTKKVYDRIMKERGHLANIFLAQGMDPDVLEDHFDLYVHLMIGPGPLSREEREMIAVVVSAANRSAYGAIHHSEALETVEKDPKALYNLLKEFASKHETLRSKGLLAYAAKLTLDPKDITKDDIDDLRDAGLTDEEILRANLIASYFNFSNRIALGLGVELEEGEARTYKY